MCTARSQKITTMLCGVQFTIYSTVVHCTYAFSMYSLSQLYSQINIFLFIVFFIHCGSLRSSFNERFEWRSNVDRQPGRSRLFVHKTKKVNEIEYIVQQNNIDSVCSVHTNRFFFVIRGYRFQSDSLQKKKKRRKKNIYNKWFIPLLCYRLVSHTFIPFYTRYNIYLSQKRLQYTYMSMQRLLQRQQQIALYYILLTQNTALMTNNCYLIHKIIMLFIIFSCFLLFSTLLSVAR